MANDFLRSKWQAWFKLLDTNHDGLLSHKDMDIYRETFVKLHQLDDMAASRFGAVSDDWWKNVALKSHTGEITLKQFIDNLHKELSASKTAFTRKIKENFVKGWGNVCNKRDGFISEEEHIMVYKALGQKDEGMVRRMFKSLGPKDGLIAVEAMADAWTDFVSSDDSSSPNKIKEALDTAKI